MDNTLELYTPSTGFPDLEIKIAYGILRVCIEAKCENFKLEPLEGYYKITIKDSCDIDTLVKKLDETFKILLERILTSKRFFEIGVKKRFINKCVVSKSVLNRIRQFAKFADFYSQSPFYSGDRSNRTQSLFSYFCLHKSIKSIKKFGGRSGLLLIASSHAGKVYINNPKSRKNMQLCELCGYLAVLGFYSFGFIVEKGSKKDRSKKYLSLVLPIPHTILNKDDILEMFSLQKRLYYLGLSGDIPIRCFTLLLLSKVPSLASFLKNKESNFSFHIADVSIDGRETRIENTAFVDVADFVNFVSDNSYNVTTIDTLVKGEPKISPFIELINFLENKDYDSLCRFVREYAVELSRGVYRKNIEYLSRRINMSTYLDNPSICSLARTFGYFVWDEYDKNYSYIDRLRSARDIQEAKEVIASLVREAKLRYNQRKKEEEEGKKVFIPHIPRDEELKEIEKLLFQNLRETITAIYILAFSFNYR